MSKRLSFTGHSLYSFPRSKKKNPFQVVVETEHFEVEDIKDISCGALHILFLLNNGDVYGVGNDEYGQLGLGKKKKNGIISKLPFDEPVKQISCGDTHSALLTNDNRIYYTGTLDHPDQLNESLCAKEFAPLELPEDVTPAQIACGYKRIYFVCSEGNLFGLGNNKDGVLGCNLSDRFLASFKKAKFSKKVREIACGKDHTVVLGKDGKVYGIGSDSFGQIGLLRRRKYSVPSLIPTLEKKQISKIRAGSRHSVFISLAKQSVFVTGKNDQGQLGVGHIRDCTQPTQVFHYRFAKNASIVDAQCASTNTFFISSDDKVYGCGKNDWGQLGTGGFLKPFQPSEVKGSSGTERIFCGRNYALFIRGAKQKKSGTTTNKRKKKHSSSKGNRLNSSGLSQTMPVTSPSKTMKSLLEDSMKITAYESPNTSLELSFGNTSPIPQKKATTTAVKNHSNTSINKKENQQQESKTQNQKENNNELLKEMREREEHLMKLQKENEGLKKENQDLQERVMKNESPKEFVFYNRLAKVCQRIEIQIEICAANKDFQKCHDLQTTLDEIKGLELDEESLNLLHLLENSKFFIG